MDRKKIMSSRRVEFDSQYLLSRREVLKRGLYAGLAAGGLLNIAGGFGCRRGPGSERPNILLITLDTTRFDRLSCYGYLRKTTPNLDKLAGESVLFTRAIATSSWTLPTHASLFTGKFPSSHGANYDPEGPLSLTHAIHGPAGWSQYRAQPLADNVATLAEILNEAGYATGAVVGGPWMKRVFGVARGFDYYDDGDITGLNGRPAASITPSATDWVLKTSKQPFFLFRNYFDAHTPYSAPEEFVQAFAPEARTEVERYLAGYDSEILYVDHNMGLLFEKLRERELYDKTMIIVTADHGELLGENGKFGHGRGLSEPELRIPLLVKYPYREVSPGQSEVWIQLTDILPLILDRVAVPVPEGIQGSLPPRILHPIIAELHENPVAKTGSWQAIYEEGYKFITNSEGARLLYNIENDAGESTNLVERESRRAELMETRLKKYIAELPRSKSTAAPRKIDAETEKALRSLGYVE